MGMGHVELSEQLGILIEEAGFTSVGSGRRRRRSGGESGSISPVKTVVAGPVMKTG